MTSEFINDSNILNNSMNLEYLTHLTWCTLGIPFYILDKNNKILKEFSSSQLTNPFYMDKLKLFSQLIYRNEFCNYPIFRITNFAEIYFYINVYQENLPDLILFAGPCITSKFNDELIIKIVNDLGLKYKNLPALKHYYESIPVIETKKLVSGAAFLFSNIYNQKLDYTTLIENNFKRESFKILFDEEVSSNILLKRQENNFFTLSVKYMNNALSYVKQGNKEKMKQAFFTNRPSIDVYVSKNDPIRNFKSLFIYCTILTMHRAIAGGIDANYATSIMESYVQRIEDIYNNKDISKLFVLMFCDFVDSVQAVKEEMPSEAVIKCKDYITKHLYEKINLADISKAVFHSPFYLSRLFKKYAGINISEYIQKEKVEESKRLLIQTNNSVTEIAKQLNFCDQSHFTKMFKKFNGISPKHYRAIYSK